MKIAFVHFSDLFFPSGTAVMYRRIFKELSNEHEIVHLVGFRRNGRSAEQLDRAYRTEINTVRPVCLKLNPIMRTGYRLRRTAVGNHSLLIPGVFLRAQINRIFEQEKPDVIWWSSDYLPESFSTLYALRDQLPKGSHLHIGILDPPELFAGKGAVALRKTMALHQTCLQLAHSFSCIGKNLQTRIQAETGKPVFVINDFVSASPISKRQSRRDGGTIRAGISGRIYNLEELRVFVTALGQAFPQSEVLWYGNYGQEKICRQIAVPANVRVLGLAPVAREQIAQVLAESCDLAYLSMPENSPEFARYSVPTKLVTYVEAGLPVAYHAPIDSEIHVLNLEHGFGCNLTTALNPNECIRDLVKNQSRHLAGLTSLTASRYSKNLVLNTMRQILARNGSAPIQSA